ncbi:hypothetical protein J4226_02195 [Candidatus Pacearchaeota archaeon]|nr:hypothetical protein [Candidatus Pacearchaeota archaeon]
MGNSIYNALALLIVTTIAFIIASGGEKAKEQLAVEKYLDQSTTETTEESTFLTQEEFAAIAKAIRKCGCT